MSDEEIKYKLQNVERYFESIRECIKRGDFVNITFSRDITDNNKSKVEFEVIPNIDR